MADYLSQLPTIAPEDLPSGTGSQNVIGFAITNGKESIIQMDSDIQAQVDSSVSSIATLSSDIGTIQTNIDDLQADKMDLLSPATEGYILTADASGQAIATTLLPANVYTTSRITISTGTPTGGVDGDIWFKVDA